MTPANPTAFAPLLDRAKSEQGTLNAAVFVGSMPDQADIDADPSLIDGTVTDSFTGPARFLQMLAPMIEERGAGTIVGVGSVAGDRGRIGNYVYGAAKAGFAHLSVRPAQPPDPRGRACGDRETGLRRHRDDLGDRGDVPGRRTPEKVAGDILKAVAKKRNVIYTPFFWRYIMLIIRSIPEPIFKKMSI